MPPLLNRRTAWICGQGLAYWIGYAVHEPRDFAYCVPHRIACRLLGWHNVTCRGRRDHVRQYQEGGWLKPGPTLSRNTSGKPEPVIHTRH